MDALFTGPWSMRLSDAEVADAYVADDGLHVRFAVVPVHGADDGQRTPAALNASGVTLHLAHLQSHRIDPGCIGRVADGQVTLDGLTLAPLSLPLQRHGAIVLRLRLANGAGLEAAGATLRLDSPGGLHLHEHLHC